MRILLALAPSLLALPAAAQEVIVLKSGQVNGAPGVQFGDPDDVVTCIANDECCDPFQDGAFTPADFAAAAGGAPARVVRPFSGWSSELPSDPDARWIHAFHDRASDYGMPPYSVLYAIPFDVSTENPVGTITLEWAVDDRLGDYDGEPNEGGAYVNGVALGDAARGGDWPYASGAVLTDVPLLQGQNVLHLYARDDGGGWAGILFSATIEVGDCVAAESVHCTSLPNSTGSTATIDATGSLSLSANDTFLHSAARPAGTFGVFLYGHQPASYPFGDGVLCVLPFGGGPYYVGTPHVSDVQGQGSVWLDLGNLPAGGEILSGETTYFQCIFRDPGGPGGSGFNLSDGLALVFCP